MQLLWSITHNFMPIERSLLNLLSFCRVIRHKSLFPNRIYANGIRKLFASCAKSIVKWIEVGSGWGAEKPKWLHNGKSAETSCTAQFVREMKKRKYFESFFRDIVFPVQFDALDPRTQEQFWAENCQSWFLNNPDFSHLNQIATHFRNMMESKKRKTKLG